MALETGAVARWDELAEMSRGGIEMGSHALDHPILARLPREEMERQVVESRRLLGARIGSPIRFFSYPNGKYEDVTPEVEAAVRAAGYLGAVSTVEGRVGLQSNPFMLERKGATRGMSAEAGGRFHAALFSAELAGIFDLLLQRRRRGRAIH
jgi:peptidoglycan/xylan/chitin deacetylase (PgdA/CDA1 family)